MEKFNSNIVIGLESNKMNEENFNIVIDESGDPVNYPNNPKNRVIGGIIFLKSYDGILSELKEFVGKNSILSELMRKKPHKLTYKKIIRCSKTNNIDKEGIIILILDFLIKNGCKFQVYPQKSNNKSHPKLMSGEKFSNIIKKSNLNIIGNILLQNKRKNIFSSKINIYCDKETYPFQTPNLMDIIVFFNDNSWTELIKEKNVKDYVEGYKRCDFKIIEKHGSDLLHNCADIIAGVARDNLDSKNPSPSYIFILKNRYADIAYNEFA